MAGMANAEHIDEDIRLWKAYKANPSPASKSALLNRFSGLINAQVNKWSGQIPREALLNEARILALKAFDSYKPSAGAALATHVTNGMLPLSRVVYTYQNTARMPENVTLRVGSYNSAVDRMKNLLGREPTTDELHSELGWNIAEINRVRDYNRRDLVESGPAIGGEFFRDSFEDDDDILLHGIFMELMPDEKKLFELTTGFNGRKPKSNPEIIKELGITQAQLSYKKTMLRKKIEGIMSRPGIKARYGG